MHGKLLVFTVALLAHYAAAGVKVICYYKSLSAYNGYYPEDFDAGLCSYVIYASATLSDDGKVKAADDDLDIRQDLYYRFTSMRGWSNLGLESLISVGGAGAGVDELFSGMARDSGKRSAFIESILHFIADYHFNGLDIDWVPNGRNRENFMTLLREIRNEFNELGYLLTAAVTANPSDIYDVEEMNNLLDWFNVKTYDIYNGSSILYTRQTSPLYASHLENDWEKHNLNLDACATNWVNAGVPKSKLALGVAFYGRSFTLADKNQHDIHAPIKGVGVNYGELDYHDICSQYYAWTRVWDDEQKNPYKYSGDQWFGYEDDDSISMKADYIKNNGYMGVLIWSLDGDDVHGKCGLSQTLLKHINSTLAKIN